MSTTIAPAQREQALRDYIDEADDRTAAVQFFIDALDPDDSEDLALLRLLEEIAPDEFKSTANQDHA